MAHRQGVQAVCDRVPRCPTGGKEPKVPRPLRRCRVTLSCTLHKLGGPASAGLRRALRGGGDDLLCPLHPAVGCRGMAQGRHGEEDVMRAIVQDAYGSADVLRLAETDKPAIAANEVLVEVRAAGVDRGTGHLLAGQPYLMR